MLRLETITNGFEYTGEFLSKDDLIDLLNYNGGKFEDFIYLIDYLNGEDNNYISDSIASLSDSKVDIYYHDLRKWAVDNYSYIEEAMNEYGTPEKFDFHNCIAMGQYYAYSNEFYTLVNEFKEYIENNYKF